MSRQVVIEFQVPEAKWGDAAVGYLCEYKSETQEGTLAVGRRVRLDCDSLSIGWRSRNGNLNEMRSGRVVSGCFLYSLRPFSEISGKWGPPLPQLEFNAAEENPLGQDDDYVDLVRGVIASTLADHAIAPIACSDDLGFCY